MAPSVELDPALRRAKRALLTDPQTSGGLLVSCDAGGCGRRPRRSFGPQGFAAAAVIGTVERGSAGLRIVA